MDATDIVERIRTLAGLATPDEARELIDDDARPIAVTRPRRRREARRLSRALPPALRELVEPADPPSDATEATFFARAAEPLSAPRERAFAREHVEATCSAIADALDPETRGMLARALAPELGWLFAPRPVGRPPARQPIAHTPSRHTLAEGKPGSSHPISEAKPEDAHAVSVARSDDPHADTRLSSSHGLTHEREHESLATGRPGPERSLDDA